LQQSIKLFGHGTPHSGYATAAIIAKNIGNLDDLPRQSF
jgi:hypothetical protein